VTAPDPAITNAVFEFIGEVLGEAGRSYTLNHRGNIEVRQDDTNHVEFQPLCWGATREWVLFTAMQVSAEDMIPSYHYARLNPADPAMWDAVRRTVLHYLNGD